MNYVTKSSITSNDIKDECIFCGKEIPPGPDFCSAQCENDCALFNAAKILNECMKRVNGEPKLILNNALGHVLGRYYGNGFYREEK